MEDRSYWNSVRYIPGSMTGHYESYFQRANHPNRPLAFWIRYTIFSPRHNPGQAVGELWAIYFDGELGKITAVKEVFPISACTFSPDKLDVKIGSAILKESQSFSGGELTGGAVSGEHHIEWSLRFSGNNPPLFLFPKKFYYGGFPKAKALVCAPNAVYDGFITLDGEKTLVEGWVGSQNHNWGSKHTDHYAWGQVAGFDNAPESFLEITTARIKMGPFWSPWLTLIVLRLGEREIALNSLAQAIRARGRFGYFQWDIESRTPIMHIHGCISATADLFIGLRYDNPPGGNKTCLNTKLARCELVLEQHGEQPLKLMTENRAAFEILTDDRHHGISIAA